MYTTPFATAGDETPAPPIGALHNGAQNFGVPEQPVVPAASNAYNLSEATYTTPFATTGDELTSPLVPVHNGTHDFGVPEHPVVPAASNAYRKTELAYTTPFATAGDEREPAKGAVHNGTHDFGVPEQPVLPPASNAYNLLSSEPTYATPFATAGDEIATLPVGATKRVVSFETFPTLMVVSTLEPVRVGPPRNIVQSHPANPRPSTIPTTAMPSWDLRRAVTMSPSRASGAGG